MKKKFSYFQHSEQPPLVIYTFGDKSYAWAVTINSSVNYIVDCDKTYVPTDVKARRNICILVSGNLWTARKISSHAKKKEQRTKENQNKTLDPRG